MRLFTAIRLPPHVLAALVSAQAKLRGRPELSHAAWTAADNLHITLKFLGQTPDSELARLTAALDSVRLAGPLHLRIDRLAPFPPRRPRMIVAAVGDEDAALPALFQAIESAVAPLGFPREGRPFHGHITLARLKTPPRLDVWPALEPALTFDCVDFSLIESRLDSRGARYFDLARFALAP